MALVACRECGQKISTEAEACPHCGVPMPHQAEPEESKAEKPKKKSRRVLWILFVTAVFVAVQFLNNEPETDGSVDSAGEQAADVVDPEVLAREKAAEEARKKEEEARKEEEKAAKLAACHADLQCAGSKYSIDANIRCEGAVAKLAKFDHKWTDSWLESKFSRFSWVNQEKIIIRYFGDKIQFQNGFGALQHHSYYCDFDTQNNSVVDVQAWPGKL